MRITIHTIGMHDFGELIAYFDIDIFSVLTTNVLVDFFCLHPYMSEIKPDMLTSWKLKW